MIWNPWKEIAKLREQLYLHINIATEKRWAASSLKSEKEVLHGRIDALEAESSRIQEKLNHADELTKTLLDEAIDYDLEIGDLLATLEMIAGEAKPTSNATVKRMAAMAQAELDARADGDQS